MSTHIIDQIAAVKFPQELTGYTIDYYLLATLSGDNNVIDCASGRRSRTWNPWVAEQHYRCLAKACNIAADFCGGCCRMVSGRSTPEAFIKRCRETLDAAPAYNDPRAVFRIGGPGRSYSGSPAITFTAEEKAGDLKYYFERLEQKRGKPEPREIYLRGKVEAFPFDFTQPREAATFIEHLPYNSPLWYHLSLAGPGEV